MAVIDDGFSGEGADTDLVNHTPDTTGTGWTNVESTGAKIIRIETATPADTIRPDFNESDDRTLYTAQGTYPSNEYDVEIDVINEDAGDNMAGVLGRLTDASNYYAVMFVRTAGADLFLVKKVAGVVTTIASADTDEDFPLGTTVKLQIRDAAKKVFIDDVEKISDADDALTSTGEAAVAFGNVRVSTDDISSIWNLDNFLVTDAAAAPADNLATKRVNLDGDGMLMVRGG